MPRVTAVDGADTGSGPDERSGRTSGSAISLAVGELARGRLGRDAAAELAGMSSAEFDAVLAATDLRRDGGGDAIKPTISAVLPVFNEQENLLPLYERLAPALRAVGPYEIVFVDDGSSDRSPATILELRDRDPAVKLVQLTRNFGHQAALWAGVEHARGDAVVLMDSDLQDPPEVIHEFVQAWRAGHEVAYAVRQRRKESAVKRAGYYVFYRTFRALADVQMPVDSGDFCLMDRKVVDALKELPERGRFLRGLRSWVGYRQVGVPYERPARFAGDAKYTMRRLVRLAMDGLLSFSSFPLRLASYLGLLTAGAGVLYLLVAVAARLYAGEVPQGWTSIVAIVLILGGIQLLVTGVLGAYLARVYEETKDRPTYMVRDVHGLEPTR
jgi:dolichol-phosphate mannosyltransferase